MSWDGPRRVLVGVDDSETAGHALAHAAGLARRHGSELIVVHVRVRPMPRMPTAEDVDAWLADEHRFARELRRNLEVVADELGVACRLVDVEGSPFHEITRCATEEEVDAVVVGASTQLSHRVVGSIAGRLVRAARWPITVVP